MKLPEHVDLLHNLITAAFDKQFSRLGLSPTDKLDLKQIPQDLRSRRQHFEVMFQSHLGETGSYENAREKLVDELTFTLFNRIAAVKVMEAASLLPPIITKQPEHGDRSFGHKAWLEIRPDMRNEELEGIRKYILYAFNELGDTLPLYSRSYPYALLPDAISLNEIIEAFNAVEKDSRVGSDIWHSDDVLGWLYESYNNAKKEAFKDSGEKTEYDKVSLQSQVYTPRWVVQFLVDNSLGKLYLEMYPDSEIKNRYKIANAPTTQERKRKRLPEIKLIDPACGSGNFLLYAFDLFYDLYLDQIENYGADFDEDDIPRLIIEHNLHGIDLDDRAVQLAQLGLYIKARKRRCNVGSLHFNVVSSDFYLPDYEAVRHIFETGTQLDKNQKALIADIWGDLQNAYKFGSLIRLDEKLKARFREVVSKRVEPQPQIFTDKELGVKPKPVQQELFLEHDIEQERRFATNFFNNLKAAVEQYVQTLEVSFLVNKTKDAITFLELLTTEYDLATANPPYIYSRDYGKELREFMDQNYRKPGNYYRNLYAAFIKKGSLLINPFGKLAMIHPRTLVFISSFYNVRSFILENFHINIFVDYGLSDLFGSIMVDPCFYILEAKSGQKISAFIGVDEYTRTPLEKSKKKFTLEALDNYCNSVPNKHLHVIQQDVFKVIDGSPFIFWISSSFREKFKQKCIADYFEICNGVQTGGNNERFYRFWWEIDRESISKDYQRDQKKWVFINKGGDFNKWYGNLWLVFEWSENGKQLRSLKPKFPSIRISAEEYYFEEGLAFSGSSTKGLSVRYQPNNCIFEVSGKSIFPKSDNSNIWYLLSFLNSKLSFYIINSLNPTVSFQSGDIARIPYIVPSEKISNSLTYLSKRNKDIKKRLTEFHLEEHDYHRSIFRNIKNQSLKENIILYNNYENHLLSQVLINEAIINEKIYDVYELSVQDRAMVQASMGESIGCLPISAEVRDAYLSEGKAITEFPLDNILDFIRSLPIKNFTNQEQEIIEKEFPSLYQNNNDLEEFCTRYHLNPINVWYWFKNANVIPEQRLHTMAMEFLADMIRVILFEDEDGIIPLVPNTGERILLDRIEQKFREYGFSMAQYSQFDSVLGQPISEYLNKNFFADLSDHLNLFMYFPKTPFIWHLSSGPDQGFDCYLIIYKWSRDKLMRIRSVYIENRERALINRQSDLAGNDSAEAQNEKETIYNQLREIEAFKVRIDELLADGYDPKLDDGVGKNIAPLQKKKMITYEVLNPGQFKKYLNADW